MSKCQVNLRPGCLEKITHNSSKFLLITETNTKKLSNFRNLYSFKMQTIVHLALVNLKKMVLVKSIIQELKVRNIALIFCESVSLVRGNLRELR